MPAVDEAPAPVRRARSQVSTDVFGTIFGESDAPMQPLNPAHRTDASASSRSYQRRGKK